MLTIKGKIIIASIIAFGLTLGIFSLVVYRSIRQAELAKLDARLEAHAEKLNTEIEEQSDEGVFPTLDDLLEISTQGLPSVRIQIWDTTGQIVVADSLLSRSQQAGWRSSVLTAPLTQTLPSSSDGLRCRWYPVEVDERIRYVLQLAAPLTSVDESLHELRVLFGITIPLALLFVAVAAYVITRVAFRPLTNMATAAQGIDGSNLESRLIVPGAQDEVRTLADTLNRMMGRIEAAFRSQKQFVADASHEIRTPLTIICSELEYAQRTASPDAVQESIRIALSEIDRLNHMVEGLLLLARADASPSEHATQSFRLDELVVETAQLVGRLAEDKAISLEIQIEQSAELAADRDMIKRAILNVLENAIKYSPPSTPVRLRLDATETETGSLRLEIEDHGPGIPAAMQDRIFERFFRTPEARAETLGSGLGLAIAKRLVELNRGQITLASQEGKGTTVTIAFPPNRSDNPQKS